MFMKVFKNNYQFGALKRKLGVSAKGNNFKTGELLESLHNNNK